MAKLVNLLTFGKTSQIPALETHLGTTPPSRENPPSREDSSFLDKTVISANPVPSYQCFLLVLG